jgi:hypothetical protein
MKSITLLWILGCIIVSGCWKHHPKPQPDSSTCRLNQILNEDSSLKAQVTYTEWGAPLKVKQVESGTGFSDFFFYYDESHRLTSFVDGIEREDGPLIWILWKYVYDGDLIIRDTMFTINELSEDFYSYFRVGEYTYDSYKRIIEYSSYEPAANTYDTLRYSYPPEDPFINNHSVFAGNKELMFVTKNYSKTNPGVVTTNEHGYPTKFQPQPVGSFLMYPKFINIEIPRANYVCSDSGFM